MTLGLQLPRNQRLDFAPVRHIPCGVSTRFAPLVLAAMCCLGQPYSAPALAIANQDGTTNSSPNPAHWGQVVTLYVTGTGDTNPSVPDGSIYQAPLPVPLINTIHSFGGSLNYVGPAPGMVAGMWQINIQLPATNSGNTSNPVNLFVSGFGTQGPYESSLQAPAWIVP